MSNIDPNNPFWVTLRKEARRRNPHTEGESGEHRHFMIMAMNQLNGDMFIVRSPFNVPTSTGETMLPPFPFPNEKIAAAWITLNGLSDHAYMIVRTVADAPGETKNAKARPTLSARDRLLEEAGYKLEGDVWIGAFGAVKAEDLDGKNWGEIAETLGLN